MCNYGGVTVLPKILWFLGVALVSSTVVMPAGMRDSNLTFTENYILGVRQALFTAYKLLDRNLTFDFHEVGGKGKWL